MQGAAMLFWNQGRKLSRNVSFAVLQGMQRVCLILKLDTEATTAAPEEVVVDPDSVMETTKTVAFDEMAQVSPADAYQEEESRKEAIKKSAADSNHECPDEKDLIDLSKPAVQRNEEEFEFLPNNDNVAKAIDVIRMSIAQTAKMREKWHADSAI